MAATPQSQLILSFEEARGLVERHAAELRPGGKDRADLAHSRGLVLAENIAADRDFPPFRRAARDGYAVMAADVERLPARLTVVGEIKAGVAPKELPALRRGQAASIMTGAPAPAEADAVVMVEYTSRAGNEVEITRGIERGANIVEIGAEAKRGEHLLSAGTKLDYAAISVAASVGKFRLQVYAKPRVAVLATGDEIVDIDLPPGPGHIRNSNSYSLAAQIQAAGGEAMMLPIAPDEPNRLRQLIGDGLGADLLLLAGGVSVGKYDLVEQVLAEFKAEFLFTGVQIQPGKPAVFGRIPRGAGAPAREKPEAFQYFFGLPGNPVSTMVTFELFARPVIEALAGKAPAKLIFLHARLKSEIKTKRGLKRFLPAILSGEFERAEVQLARWQGSGDIATMVRANCYAVIPPDRDQIAAGEWVPVLLR